MLKVVPLKVAVLIGISEVKAIVPFLPLGNDNEVPVPLFSEYPKNFQLPPNSIYPSGPLCKLMWLLNVLCPEIV